MRRITQRLTLGYISCMCVSLVILGGLLTYFLWSNHGLLVQTWQYLLGLFGLILLSGALLAVRLADGIRKPLVEIGAVARRIAAGDWEAEVRHPTGDEIGELALALNAISGAIREKSHQLTESKGRLEAVLANMESGVALFDRSGRIDLVNPSAERILGVSKSEAVGRTYVETLKNYPLIRIIDEVNRSGKPQSEGDHPDFSGGADPGGACCSGFRRVAGAPGGGPGTARHQRDQASGEGAGGVRS